MTILLPYHILRTPYNSRTGPSKTHEIPILFFYRPMRKNGNGSEMGNFWLKLRQFYLFISWINIMDFSSIAYFKACLNFFSSVSTKKNFCLCHEVRVPALFVYSGWWLKNHIIVLNLVMWNWIFDIVFFLNLFCAWLDLKLKFASSIKPFIDFCILTTLKG